MSIDEHLKQNPYRGGRRTQPAPIVRYNPSGDLLEIYWGDEPCHVKTLTGSSKRIAHAIGMETGEVVGVKVYGVRDLIDKRGRLNVDKEMLRQLVQGLFDFAEANARRPLVKLALGMAEGVVLALIDQFMETAQAKAIQAGKPS